MKESFRYIVKAPTAETAFAQVGQKHRKRLFHSAGDSRADVRKAINLKLRRVEENPAIYADKITEYVGILEKFDANGDEHDAVIAAMLAHGDRRVDTTAGCAVRQVGPSLWVVFGYDFGTD